MFRNLTDFFMGGASLLIDAGGEPSSRELHVASLAILLSVARADAVFGREEFTELVRSMNREFELPDEEAGELFEIAEFLLKEPAKLEEFIGVVNAEFSTEQRETLLAWGWNVLAADGHTDQDETRYLAELRKRLHLSPEQAIRAQQRAQQIRAERTRNVPSSEVPPTDDH